MQDLQSDIDPIVEGVFDAAAERYAKGRCTIGFPIGIKRTALSLRTQWSQEDLLALQIRIGIITEDTGSECDIRCKAVLRFAGHESEEIEIPLQSQLPNPAVKAQVSAAHVFIVVVVNVGVPQLGKRDAYPTGDIVAEILTKESGGGHFGSVQVGPGVQVAEIMPGTHSETKLTFLHHGILCRQRSETQKNGCGRLKKGANQRFHGIDLRSNGYRTTKIDNFL